MLLVLIGPYFNHSHWSVSSLTEQILFLSRSPIFLPLCHATLAHPHTRMHTRTRLQTPSVSLSSICVFCAIIHSLIHLFIQSLHHLPLLHLLLISPSSVHTRLCAVLLSLPASSLASLPNFLPFIPPSLSLPVSLFDPR